MNIWIAVALIGIILSVIGLIRVRRQFQRGELDRLSLVAIIVGFIGFLGVAFLEAFFPRLAEGPIILVAWTPVVLAIVILVRRRRPHARPR